MPRRCRPPSCRCFKDRIKDLGQPQGASNVHRRFYPASNLQSLWNAKAIIEVLRCRCEDCTTDASLHRNTDELLDFVLGRSQYKSPAVLLLSLLVLIDHPQLIDYFLCCRICDADIECNLHQFDAEHLCRTVWPQFAVEQMKESRRTAEEFACDKYRFFIPSIFDIDSWGSETNIPHFPEDVILPFMNEQPLGQRRDDGHLSQEGGFSTVYAFTILPEYDKLKGHHSQSLVRKEVPCFFEGLDKAELAALIQVQRLNEMNIVRLLAAYYHGDKLNLIFHRARTNLHSYLRSADHYQPQATVFAPEQDPLWTYVLGVLKALYRLSDGMQCDSLGHKLRGYHFDLKPANILVFDKEGAVSFMIADFGFARFADKSKLAVQLGAGPYAPPEASRPGHKHHPNYDVWSMGCILLEILAFVTGGTDGVARLDKLRYTESLSDKDSGSCFDDNFWRLKSDEKSFELKPEVKEWSMKAIQYSQKTATKFLRGVHRLILSMLDVDVSTRLTAEESYNRLRCLLSSNNSAQSLQDDSRTVSPVGSEEALPDEVELAPEHVYMLKPSSCQIGHWFREDCRIKIFEDHHEQVRICASSREDRQDFFIGLRTGATLMPRAPTHLPGFTSVRGHHNAITVVRNSGNAPYEATIHLSDSRDTLLLQSVLLGQRICTFTPECNTYSTKSLPVVRITYHTVVRSSHSVFKSSSSPANVTKKATAVQIWKETSYKDSVAWQKLRPRRLSPRTPFGGNAPTRVVFFCDGCLVTVRFGKNERLRKPLPKAHSGLQAFIPTDQSLRSLDPTFAVSVLPSSARTQEYSASIPLDTEMFFDMEEQNSIECNFLEIQFRNGTEAEMFRQRYRKSKKDWMDEKKELEMEVRQSGETRGWQPACYNMNDSPH